MQIPKQMTVMEKLQILSDAAKYDVACTSSGVARKGNGSGMGNCIAPGICHTFSGDGRCVSLLKILFTNECVFNCSYCQNRCTNDIPRASFTPDEICSLTLEFYRRNYIEGLFLSSGILISPNYTMELIYQALYQLRVKHHFNGYIHVKAIPGADPALIERTGFLADAAHSVTNSDGNPASKAYPAASSGGLRGNLSVPSKRFVPAGQSTQMIIGATPENDYQIMSVAEGLYQKFELKRVFYSAFVNVNEDSSLPVLPGGPPLLREHRLYQADWLLRYYHFSVKELLSEDHPNFNIYLDPKCDWALRHLEYFPVEINRAGYQTLLRVPGIGAKSAKRILQARHTARLDFDDLKKMGVVLKRALYFITCSGRMMYRTKLEENYICENLLRDKTQIPRDIRESGYRQISLFDVGMTEPPQPVQTINTLFDA